MNVFQCFILALKSLATSKIRALLTMLGIIIGVGAVIIIMSLGNGVTNEVSDAFDSLGTNSITVSVMGRGSTRSISADEMYEMASENSEVIKAISPTVNCSAQVRIGSDSYGPSMTGVGEDYPDIKSLNVQEGRFLNYIDIAEEKRVCVVGAYYNSTEAFNGQALGNTIKLNGYVFTIIGVLENQSDDWEDDSSSDNMILVPYSTAAKLLSRTATISSYTVLAMNDDTVSSAKTVVENTLYKAFGNENAYSVVSMAEMLDEVTGVMDIMVVALALIAGISLLVAGIGIMNIMLVSVAERTREIGTRKALGASAKTIKEQFLFESVVISQIGCALGVFMGVLAGNLVAMAMKASFIIPWLWILAAIAVCLVVGIASGYIPAVRASKLDPIEALRYE